MIKTSSLITDEAYPTIRCFLPGGEWPEILALLPDSCDPQIGISVGLLCNWIAQRVKTDPRADAHRYYFAADYLRETFPGNAGTRAALSPGDLPVQSGTILMEDGFQLIYGLVEEATTMLWSKKPGKTLVMIAVEGSIVKVVEEVRIDGNNIFIREPDKDYPELRCREVIPRFLQCVLLLNHYHDKLRKVDASLNKTAASIYLID